MAGLIVEESLRGVEVFGRIRLVDECATSEANGLACWVHERDDDAGFEKIAAETVSEADVCEVFLGKFFTQEEVDEGAA